MTKDEIDLASKEIQNRANERIGRDFPSWHPLEYRARTEMIAEEVVPPGWDWTVSEIIGGAPCLLITGYDPRLAARR